MGSSARKKKEKAKDFKKQKLRVGQRKAKPDNFTDTSFKSKSIVVKEQSLRVNAPSCSSNFIHHISLAATSKSANQRRDALSFLISQISALPVNHEFPIPISTLCQKLSPLILDGSNSVRNQLLKFFRFLPISEIIDQTESILLYIRAGMTHLSLEIRQDALEFLEWLLQVVEEEVISCPGGWLKTLKCFMSMMGWAVTSEKTKWTSGTKASFSNSSTLYSKQIHVLTKFLNAGLVESENRLKIAAQNRRERESQNIKTFPMIDVQLNMIPKIPNAYAYLDLFGTPRDLEGEAYADRKVRQRAFGSRFLSEVRAGIERARKEGGEIGRAAAALDETLRKGMIDYGNFDQH